MSLPTTAVWATKPPAYNIVSANTVFMRPASQPPMMVPPESRPKKVEWPQPVRAYVRRAFDPDNEIDGITQEDMTDRLKIIISYYAERQLEGQVDWSTYPLPQEFILRDRNGSGFATEAQRAYVTPTNCAPAVTTQPPKRKSQDMQAPSAGSAAPPGRKTDLQDRITYGNGHKEKRQKKNDNSQNPPSKFDDQADLERRRQRFQRDFPRNNMQTEEPDIPSGPVVGTNQELEKSFFRLTARPKPEAVRPQYVLEKTFVLLQKKWKEEKNYNYVCNQFKSLRQDLTVQHVKNAFTVKVYETHARIALEKGDLGEYNQCQTQLKALYLQKHGGNPGEFLGYRILYLVYTCNKTDMNDLLAELTPADKAQPPVKHALEVRASLALSNYHKFFRLYLQAPNMGGYLMDMFIERERLHALANISRGYMSVALRFLSDELGFESNGECFQFLNDHSAKKLVEQKSDGSVRVRVKEGAAHFEQLRAIAFSRVDIKGQI